SRAVLAESFCGMSGGMLARALKSAGDKVAAGQVPLTARVVHDWLDKFYPETPTLEKVRTLAGQWAEHDLAQLLLQGEGEATLQVLQTALAAPTSKQILVSLLAARSAGNRYLVPGGIFPPDVLLLLERVQSAPKDRPAHNAVTGALPTACPKNFD